MVYTIKITVVRLVSMSCFNSKAMPTDDTDYIATIYTLHNLLRQSYMGLITYHIMPLVIYSLAADTHTHTQHAYL